MKHNHLTRNILKPGKCPACDIYHLRHIDGCACVVVEDEVTLGGYALNTKIGYWRPCPTSVCERPDHDHFADDAYILPPVESLPYATAPKKTRARRS